MGTDVDRIHTVVREELMRICRCVGASVAMEKRLRPRLIGVRLGSELEAAIALKAACVFRGNCTAPDDPWGDHRPDPLLRCGRPPCASARRSGVG